VRAVEGANAQMDDTDTLSSAVIPRPRDIGRKHLGRCFGQSHCETF
jgi:hypothetical protein